MLYIRDRGFNVFSRPILHVSACVWNCIQTCNGASDDLVREVGEDEDPGDSNCHQHQHIEQVGGS